MKLVVITCMLLCCFSLNSTSQTSFSNELDSFLSARFNPNEPGGVVMASKNGKVIYKKAFGMADLELNVPVNDSMVFYIGSNTKQFTAVAILQLVEKNKLQLQDTLGKYLPAAPCPVSNITLAELLSHTAGLTEKNDDVIKKLLANQKPVDSLVKDIIPGVKWEYSNTGFTALGYIIENVTGMPYKEYIKEYILKPACMTNSYIDENNAIIKNRADGYSRARHRNVNLRPTNNMGPAGGIMSTVDDMLKWTEVLKTNILLKQETLQLAFTPHKLRNGSATGYGLGWYLEELKGSPARRHGGRTFGYTSETLYLPKESVYVIILTNSDYGFFPIRAVTRVVAGMAINKPFVLTDQPIDVKELDKFIGVYKNHLNEIINITREEGKLIFQRPGGNKYPLGSAGNNEFFFHREIFRLKFTEDAAGKIARLDLSQADINPMAWIKTQP
ncbi:MAG TPA: serine hydrolase domain-containing protein [Niastella sp.]